MKRKIFLGDPATGKTRTTRIIASCFENKDVVTVDGRSLNLNYGFCLKSCYEGVKLLIIDDVPKDFNYSYFFSNTLIVQRQLKLDLVVEIPNIIFTTNGIEESTMNCTSFNRRFEIINFPLV